jgi:hypothetical protein
MVAVVKRWSTIRSDCSWNRERDLDRWMMIQNTMAEGHLIYLLQHPSSSLQRLAMIIITVHKLQVGTSNFTPPSAIALNSPSRTVAFKVRSYGRVWGKAHLALYVKLPVVVCSRGLIKLGKSQVPGSVKLFNWLSNANRRKCFGGCKLPCRACFSVLRTGGGSPGVLFRGYGTGGDELMRTLRSQYGLASESLWVKCVLEVVPGISGSGAGGVQMR